MIWLVGFIIVIIYSVFNAGRNTKSLFSNRSDSTNVDKVMFYVMGTLGLALLWPIALPGLGIYLLGKKLAK